MPGAELHGGACGYVVSSTRLTGCVKRGDEERNKTQSIRSSVQVSPLRLQNWLQKSEVYCLEMVDATKMSQQRTEQNFLCHEFKGFSASECVVLMKTKVLGSFVF